MLYKGTNNVYGTPENEDIPVLDEMSFYQMNTKCKNIVQQIFNKHKKQLNQNQDMDIILYLDSQTGKVLEVDFEFHESDSFVYIPIEDFRYIEKELKKQIQFQPTVEGKKLTYIYSWWAQQPE